MVLYMYSAICLYVYIKVCMHWLVFPRFFFNYKSEAVHACAAMQPLAPERKIIFDLDES